MGTKRQQGSALLISCIIVAAVALVGCFYFQNVLADIFLLTGAAVLWILFFRQQKKGENVRELLYRELMFDALSNNVDDIFVMLDSETWQVDYISPNVERLLGFPQADVKANICLLAPPTGRRLSPGRNWQPSPPTAAAAGTGSACTTTPANTAGTGKRSTGRNSRAGASWSSSCPTAPRSGR